jgi:hypothetical protein
LGGAGVDYEVYKEGFYTTIGRLGYGNHDVEVVIRKKINPIAMYAKKDRISGSETVYGEWVGYDFFVGDYLFPYGIGVVSDIEFKVKYEREDTMNQKLNLSIRLPNEGDGLVSFYTDYPWVFTFYSGLMSQS